MARGFFECGGGWRFLTFNFAAEIQMTLCQRFACTIHMSSCKLPQVSQMINKLTRTKHRNDWWWKHLSRARISNVETSKFPRWSSDHANVFLAKKACCVSNSFLPTAIHYFCPTFRWTLTSATSPCSFLSISKKNIYGKHWLLIKHNQTSWNELKWLCTQGGYVSTVDIPLFRVFYTSQVVQDFFINSIE